MDISDALIAYGIIAVLVTMMVCRFFAWATKGEPEE